MYNGGQVHVITHTDTDGHAAAAVVKQYHPDAWVVITNYKKQIHLNKFKPGDTVYVTDFSLSKEVFEILAGKNIRIIWCDHHMQAVEELQKQGWNCEGIRRGDYSGAMLTWMYFNPDKTFDQAPDFLKLVNWYDLWQHDKDPRIRAFVYGIGLWDTRPGYVAGDRLWNNLFSNTGDAVLKNIVMHGQVVQKYVEKYQDLMCSELAYRTVVDTPKGPKNVLAMAVRSGNSSIYERQDVHDIDALFTSQFFANIGQYRSSMYSPDNVKEILEIANMFGGGGHPTAAGFTLPRYPINYPQRKKPMPLEEVVRQYEEVYAMRKASAVLQKYGDRANSVTAKVSGWHADYNGYHVIAFNHQYLPEMLPSLSISVDCIDPDSGSVADLYIGYVMTNSGLFRCCAYPTSTSIDPKVVLSRLQERYMTKITEDTYTFKLINGGVWWYQDEEPVPPKINFNIQSSSVN